MSDSQHGEQQFLQSLEWERFQRALGKETFRVGESLFVIEQIPLGLKYAYCPRGPREIGNGKRKTENRTGQEDYQTPSPSAEGEVSAGRRGRWAFEDIVRETKKRNCAWVRIEPLEASSLSVIRYPFSVRKAPKDIQPREILVMDITPSEDELLSVMKAKTRYNIRLAEKKGVEVIVSNDARYCDRFFDLVRETAERAGIRSHDRHHYEKLIDTLGEDMARLYIATYQGEVIAINLMIFFENFAIYLHGGSSNVHRNVMAPFLLQWRAIQDAKKRGCRWYDFGGVSTPLSSSPAKGESRVIEGRGTHSQRTTQNSESEASSSKIQVPSPWAGITRFKQGFAPNIEPVRFPGTYDVVLKPLVYRLYTKLSCLKRVL